MPEKKKAMGKTRAAAKPKTRKARPAAGAAKPERTQEAPSSSVRRLRVKQVRSGIGRAATYRRTLVALGLRHYQAEVVVADTPSMQGMLHKVRHLIRVTTEEAR